VKHASNRATAPELSVPPAARPYLSAAQLAELTPWTEDAIEKMVNRGVLRKGVHYYQLDGGRNTYRLYNWAAIAALIEGRPVPIVEEKPVDRPPAVMAEPRAQKIDVEKASRNLQELLG
jgi:hypothetical protein